MRRRLLMVARMRYALPLSPTLAEKFDALDRVVQTRVLASRAPGSRGTDPRFQLVSPVRPRAVDGPLFYALLPVRVARELRRSRPEVVLVQGAQETALVLLGRFLSRVPAKVVADVHGDPRAATTLYGSRLRHALTPLGNLLARIGLTRADGVRTISGYTRDLVRDTGVDPVAVFPAFMDLEPFTRLPTTDPPSTPRVLFVGVLERYKAVDVLADAWRLVAERLPAAELEIVGRGALADVPARLVAERPETVRWRERLTTDEVATALDDATLLVLPSRSEGLGRVVIEAFCRRRPVVGSRVGGIPDLVTDGRNGLLVTPESPRELADAIVRLLTDPELAARLGAQARQDVEPWLASPDDYAARVRDLVEAVAA